MSMLHRLGVLALVAMSTMAAAQGPPPANARLDAVREEIVAQQRAATGQIVSLRRSAVATQEPGLVLELDLEPGDLVEQGAVIARLDDSRARLDVLRWEARIEADKAMIEQREAEVARADRELERIEQLAVRASTGPGEMDLVRTEVLTRRAQLSEAKASLRVSESELALAQRRLDDMTIRAPFKGRVVSKQTEAGQWLAQGAPVVTIVSLDQLEARADIPERSVGALQRGNGSISVFVPAFGRYLEGQLVEIVPEADSLSRLFPIRIRVTDPEGMLRPGMSLSATVPTGETGPALTISPDAILRNQAGEFVYFDAGGIAQVAPITRLFSAGGRVAVRSPMLREGSLLVVEGNERMFPGQPLNVLNADDFPEVAQRQAEAAAAAAEAQNGRNRGNGRGG